MAQAAVDFMEQYMRAEQRFLAGDLKESANLCREVLANNPDFAHGYYLMGALFRATGNHDKAIQFTDLAIGLDAGVALFHLQRGQSLFALGDNARARDAFAQACRLDPRSAIARMLLADAHAQLGEFDRALAIFAETEALEDLPDIDEHRGLCLQMHGKPDEAEAMFDRVITRRPDYDGGYIHKGKIRLERQDSDGAEKCFRDALTRNPDAHQALLALGAILRQRGQNDEALDLGTRAVMLRPDMLGGYLFVGALLMADGKPAQAERVYRTALSVKPEDQHAMHGMVDALVKQRKLNEALLYVEKLLSENPDNPVLRYFRSMLGGERMEAAPPEYVRSLFDHYAEQFDYHLEQKLSYCTHIEIARAVERVLSAKQRPVGWLSLLDLGCGTGLAANALASLTRDRVGVDLSPRIIEKARAKQIYRALHVADIVEFLNATSERYDLVVSADVMIYIGNLETVMASVRRVLAPGGLFAFSVEEAEGGEDYVLQPVGRYAHARGYIERMVEAYGYCVLTLEPMSLRTGNALPIKGLLAVLEMVPSH